MKALQAAAAAGADADADAMRALLFTCQTKVATRQEEKNDLNKQLSKQKDLCLQLATSRQTTIQAAPVAHAARGQKPITGVKPFTGAADKGADWPDFAAWVRLFELHTVGMNEQEKLRKFDIKLGVLARTQWDTADHFTKSDWTSTVEYFNERYGPEMTPG